MGVQDFSTRKLCAHCCSPTPHTVCCCYYPPRSGLPAESPSSRLAAVLEASARPGCAGYADAVMSVYACLPVGQLYDDLRHAVRALEHNSKESEE